MSELRTYGLSRDDAGSFLPEYKEKGIVEQDWPEGKRQVHLTQARAHLGKGSWWLTCLGFEAAPIRVAWLSAGPFREPGH